MPRSSGFHRDERGQTIIILALLLTILLGFYGLVADVGWLQIQIVRAQRAADAAALAGAPYLPGNVAGAITAAKAEATKNGFTNAVNGATVTAAQDTGNANLLNVTVTGSASTFTARLFGVTSFPTSRQARAEFILPVPMGSPLSYWGVHVLCRNSDTPPACPAVASAAGGAATLATLGYWGGIEMKGSQRANGDAYSTFYNGGTSPNAGYDPKGYSYIVEVPNGATAQGLYVYDPIFCATGAGTSSGRRLGVGDFWLGSHTPVTTEYKLWDMLGTPYSTLDDVMLGQSGALFAGMDFVDKSTNYKGTQDYGAGYNGSSSTDCALNPNHNAWWLVPGSVGLDEGLYRLQVVTSGGTTSENAVNNFGLQVVLNAGASGGRVYGQSRMCVFNAISGTSLFYLAQIALVHAGKTLDIKLFDPGDISSTSLKVKVPTTTGYVDATFSFTATGSSGGGPTSGSNLTTLVTSTSSVSYYNNQWVTLTVVIPTTYTAPTPPGEPGPGWWKIQYTTAGTGQDVTTWEVTIRGNPVHLIVP